MPLRDANRLAKVGLAGRTEIALAAFGCVQRDDVIAYGNRRYTVADLFDDGAAFVAKYGWKYAFGVVTRERKSIGVANSGCDVAKQKFARLWSIQINGFDFEWFTCFPGDGGACLHCSHPPVAAVFNMA